MIPVGGPQFLFMAEAEGLDELVTTETAHRNAQARKRRESIISHSPGRICDYNPHEDEDEGELESFFERRGW